MQTTRKFSRTMSEAFPNTAHYACSIERVRRYEEAFGFVLATVIGVVLAGVLVIWWSA